MVVEPKAKTRIPSAGSAGAGVPAAQVRGAGPKRVTAFQVKALMCSLFFFEKLTLLAILLLLSLCKTAAICVDVKGVIF